MTTREHSISSPDTHERAVTQALTRAYTVNWETLALVALLLLAVITRFYDLGTRVMSHDESLHTYYSWRLSEYGEFSHTPLMHGPLLFHMNALFYFLFGDSDFTARLYPAILGVLIVGFPWLFRRWLGRTGALIVSGLLLISPQLMYYNRYIRHDTPTIFFALIILYAIVQYVDGVTPRRPSWLWVLAVGLIGTLASKEVAFIYIAIFGSFLALYWLLRVVQDVGIRRRPAGQAVWEAPWLQQAIGHALLLALVGVFAVTMGSFLRLLLSPVWAVPSAAWLIVPLFAVIYLPLALSGVVRRMRRGTPSGGVASAIMDWLGNGRSAFYVLVAGLILGAAVALWIVTVMDVIKPGDIWTETTARSEADLLYGQNGTKEFAVETEFNATMFVRLLTWVGLPVLGLLLALFLSAVFVFPGRLALPWRTMLVILLVALLVTSVLVMFERRSFVSETTTQPFAVDPTAVHTTDGDHYDNMPIIVAWVLGTLITLAVLGTRMLTNLWDFLNRQPIFDVLIVIGTMILPWLAGFPLYWAGYNLEDYNPNSLEGHATLEATLPAVLPFLMVAAAVGLAWNWRRWLPAAAVFLGIFAFFFTTVFSNQYGLVTGMIGSLGYWLEQQGVRRGSQPQYYYLLTQLLVYEFLPLIGALGAGGFGLVKLWRWRRDRALDALAVAGAQAEATPFAEELAFVTAPQREALNDPAPGAGEALSAHLTRPFSLAEELARRAADREWIGGLCGDAARPDHRRGEDALADDASDRPADPGHRLVAGPGGGRRALACAWCERLAGAARCNATGAAGAGAWRARPVGWASVAGRALAGRPDRQWQLAGRAAGAGRRSVRDLAAGPSAGPGAAWSCGGALRRTGAGRADRSRGDPGLLHQLRLRDRVPGLCPLRPGGQDGDGGGGSHRGDHQRGREHAHRLRR